MAEVVFAENIEDTVLISNQQSGEKGLTGR